MNDLSAKIMNRLYFGGNALTMNERANVIARIIGFVPVEIYHIVWENEETGDYGSESFYPSTGEMRYQHHSPRGQQHGSIEIFQNFDDTWFC